MTPRFAASRAVIGATTTPDGTRLAEVAKLARAHPDDEVIELEHAALDQFQRRTGVAPGAPGRHRLDRRDGRPVLVEDAASGHPLDRGRVRRHPDAALRAGIRWLDGVPVGDRTVPSEDGRGQDLLTASLRAVARLRTDHPERRRDHIRRTATLFAPLRAAAVPQVFEHGDFSHPNLFADPAGELVAIDWERARPVGLPLHDLTFFLAYLAETVDRPGDGDELVRAYQRALGPDGWARSGRDRHADHMGVDAPLVGLLELACWTRVLARLDEYARPGPVSDGHRSERLWIACIEAAEADRP